MADETDFQILGLCLVLTKSQTLKFLADQPPGGDVGVPPRIVHPKLILLRPGQTQFFWQKHFGSSDPASKASSPRERNIVQGSE
jgi:hypothetical protein